jgi:tetratricopeptide (TPR) repeat protein
MRKINFVLLIALLFVVMAFSQTNQDVTIQYKLQSAQGYFQSWQSNNDPDLLQQAVNILNDVVSTYKNNSKFTIYVAKAYFQLGDIYFYTNDNSSAIKYYIQAYNELKKLPPTKDIITYKNYALYSASFCYYNLQDYDNAIKYLDIVLSYGKGGDFYTDSLKLGATIAIESSNFDQAKKFINSYQQVSPNSYEAKLLNAQLYQKTGDQAKAINIYLSLSKLSDKNIKYLSLYNLAYIYFSQNKSDSALSYLQQALKIKQTSEAYNLLGNIDIISKKYTDAKTSFSKALELASPFEIPSILYNQGIAYYKIAQKTNSKDFYNYALTKLKSAQNQSKTLFVDAIIAQGRIYENLKEYDLAKNAYQQIIDKSKDIKAKLEAVKELGNLYLSMGKYDDAVKQYNTEYSMASAAKLTSYVEYSQYNLIFVEFTKGDADKALKDSQDFLNKFSSNDPENLLDNVYFMLGQIYYSKKDYSKSISYYKKAADKNDLDTLAKAYYSLGIIYYTLSEKDDSNLQYAYQYFIDSFNSPENDDIYLDTTFYICDVANKLGKKDELLKYATILLNSSDSSKKEWGHYFSGEAYLRLGLYSKAYTEFSTVKNSNNILIASAAYYGIARYYAIKGDFKNAEKYYNDLLNLYPNSEKSEWGELDLSILYINEYKSTKDVDFLKKAKIHLFNIYKIYGNTFKKMDVVIYYIGYVYELTGNKTNALKYYNNLINNYPSSSYSSKAKAAIKNLK